MVTPNAGREMATHLTTQYKVSQRRACRVVGVNRATMRSSITKSLGWLYALRAANPPLGPGACMTIANCRKVVNIAVYPASNARRARAQARWVLPMPGGPSSTTLVAVCKNAKLDSSRTSRSETEGWKLKSNVSRQGKAGEQFAPDVQTLFVVVLGARHSAPHVETPRRRVVGGVPHLAGWVGAVARCSSLDL